MKPKALIVFVTAANRKEADRLAKILVQKRLAACVSIVSNVSSRYWWKSRIEVSKELLLIVKTSPARYKALEKQVINVHSYSIPEILALPIVRGSADYLKWLKQSVQ